MSQIENKMDDFMPFGGEIRSKYPEDDEKTEVSESMRYGMEGVGLPMLDAAEHLANY